MTFVHPLLLGGLLLMGIPVLLHLLLQQKARHLPFPAFRFLLQKHRTNQRTIRLRHLLLLLLRMALIAALCLALARPKIGERPVAVLLFDTSSSMEYRAAGKSRLEVSKQRAFELLDQLPPESHVAVLDTAAETLSGWIGLTEARERIAALRTSPASAPVTSRLEDAYRLLAELPPDRDTAGDEPLRQLFVFSDRMQACWDAGRLPQLKAQREKIPSEKGQSYFADVGVDEPENLAVAELELPKSVISANDKVEIKATIRATGRAYDTEVLCKIDGERAERKPIALQAGQSQVLIWERGGLKQGPHFVEVRLANDDEHLSFTNARHAVFEVGGARRVLIIADRRADPEIWRIALESGRGFECDVLTSADVDRLDHNQLMGYRAVCLFNVAAPSPTLWQLLRKYVAAGGGLAVVPGGEELDLNAYGEDDPAAPLLPGLLKSVVRAQAKDGAAWDWKTANYHNAALQPFEKWQREPGTDFVQVPPKAERFWQVAPTAIGDVLVRYADNGSPPALLESKFDRAKISGRVLLFTTPLDGREPSWNNYLASVQSFYLTLAHLSVSYLAGAVDEANLNHLLTGATLKQGVRVPLPLTPRFAQYTLSHADKPHGLDLGGARFITQVPRPADDAQLQITQAVEPGNYSLLGSAEGKTWLTGFSLNVPPEEGLLAKVPAESIESLLGPNSVVTIGRGQNIRDLLGRRWSQTVVELFPWLMILVLLVLAVENLLANKFYGGKPTVQTDVTVAGKPQMHTDKHGSKERISA